LFDSLTKYSKICLSVVYHILYQKNKHLFENSNLALKANASDLESKAGLGTNSYDGVQSIIYPSGIGNTSYTNAQVLSRAPYSQNPGVRAMYGFENVGSNAGALYLDTDGRLKWIAHDGNTKVIDWT
jgi:hypothetical protein